MAKPLTLKNGRSWATRTAALAHFKAMLARYSNGQTVSADDHDDLHALLVHYDSFVSEGKETKIGCGVSHFTRESNIAIGWPSDGFHVHRTDGTSIDFSYIDAVNSPVNKRSTTN